MTSFDSLVPQNYVKLSKFTIVVNGNLNTRFYGKTLQIGLFFSYNVDFVQYQQFEDKCRNKSCVKSEMKRHLLAKMSIYVFKLWL